MPRPVLPLVIYLFCQLYIYLALELTSCHSAGDQNCSESLSFSKEIVSWHQTCRSSRLLDTHCRPRGKARFWRFPQIGFRRAASLQNSLVLSWCPIGCLFVCFVFACSVLILTVLFWFYLFCFDFTRSVLINANSKAPARCRIAYVTQVCRSLLSQIEQSLHSPDHFATVNTFVRLYKEQYCTLLHHVTLLIGCCDHR